MAKKLETRRKTQILEAALHTISIKGQAGVTMEEIAKAAGLSKGGLAHYYASKEILFEAAFEAFFDRVFLRCEKAMEEQNDPVKMLLGFENLFDKNDMDVILGYPILFDFMAIAAHRTRYRELFTSWVNKWVVLLQNALTLGMETGVFQGMDTEPVARSISAVYQGVASRWYLDPGFHSDQWAVETYTLAIKGILAPYMRQDRQV